MPGKLGDRRVESGEALCGQGSLNGACRDALAKTLYVRLFTWLLKQINVRLSPPREADGVTTIAVVDVFGFEVTPGGGEGHLIPAPPYAACLSDLCLCWLLLGPQSGILVGCPG